MGFEDDFIKDDVVSLDVEGYDEGSFLYKPTTAGEENAWLKDYMYVEDGKPKQDFGKLNMLKLSNLVGVPWSRDELKSVSGVDKDWKDYSFDEKVLVIGKLKGSVFDAILNAVNKFDKVESSQKKS